MNLFSVDKTIWSHPDKPYIYHIENIANSFDDKAHRISANFHDIGKLSNEFQRYIRKETKEKTTHAIEGGYLFSFLESIDENFLSIFFSIVKHHSSLPNVNDDIYKYSNINENSFEKESWNEKLAVIEKHLGVESEHSAKEFHKLMRMFVDNFKNFSTIDQFFLFKKRYSRLILADKFEAIFSKKYQNVSVLSNDICSECLDNIENIITQKQIEKSNKYRTKARKIIFNNFEKNIDSNIYLIKAPTGIGKTFIALELALKIAKIRGDKRRIITAIPFTSIIDQTHLEYEKVLGQDSVLKYHHLTKQKESIDADEKEQFSKKVFLTDIWQESFIVTTFNQLLYTFFSNRNKDNVRLETLRDSVIIIDEVQNISRVLLKSVTKVFNEFSKRYNIHFIIMSATMPSFKGLFEEAVVLSEDSFYKKDKSRYRLHHTIGLDTFESLANEINSINDKSVLCVVNTIEKAKRLFNNISDQSTKYLLTTHQIPLHRQKIIEEIGEALKKGEKVILISTQLIEAGVDLDFDVGFREFAPFGSIIQMAGRVNREGRKEISDVFIFDFIDIGRGENVKKLPYHYIDLQGDKIENWLKKPLDEIDILENLNTYFEIIKEETSSVDLDTPMINLEFAILFEKFNENFMPHQPWKVSLFIEQREGHFDEFIQKREKLLEKTKDKFEAKDRIKDMEKDLGKYTISVNHNLIEELKAKKHSVRELFGRFILPSASEYYTKKGGFNIELTVKEEAFS